MSTLSLTPEELNNLLTIRPHSYKSSRRGLSSPFLQSLTNAGREVLSKLITEEKYVAGQVVFKEGHPGNAMHIIRSGRAAIVKGDFKSPTVLGYRTVGDIVGEMALLENQPRSASVVALEALETLRIDRQDFAELLSDNPALSLSILGTLSARLRAADDARKSSARSETDLVKQVSQLKTEKQHLLELERLRQDTIDLIVHDLRHPISSLMGVVKILEMVLPEEILQTNKQLMDIANLNCDQLQLMVDSLLDVARMEAGQDQLQLTSIDFKELVKENIVKVKLSLDLENITADINVPDDLPYVFADREKIDRVLSNLLSNAIKYTPAGEQIKVDVQLQDDRILVSITDAGPGIPKEEHEKIFDRFTQIAGSHSRAGGFGLGLAFCRLAIEAHQGQIWVETGADGIGSKFTFALPLSTASMT